MCGLGFLAAEPQSTAGLLFPCQYPCGMILLTLYLMVWDWQGSRQGAMPPFLSPTVFPLSSFILWIGIVGLGSLD